MSSFSNSFAHSEGRDKSVHSSSVSVQFMHDLRANVSERPTVVVEIAMVEIVVVVVVGSESPSERPSVSSWFLTAQIDNSLIIELINFTPCLGL